MLIALTFPAQAGNTLTCKALDKYLGANGGVFHNSTVVQCDVFTTWGENGLYTDLWVSYSGEGSWQDTFGDEVDFTVGKYGTLGGLGYDVGIAYFSIADDGTNMADVWQLYLEVNKSFTSGSLTLTPFVKLEAYFASDFSDNPESGQFVKLGMKYARPLGEKWNFSGKAQAYYDSSSFGLPAGVLADADLTVSYQLTESFSVGLTGKISAPIDLNPGDNRSSETAYGLTASFKF